MLDQIETTLLQMIPVYTLWFPDLYYYYDMKLITFCYVKDFNILLQFPEFTEPYTQKSLA